MRARTLQPSAPTIRSKNPAVSGGILSPTKVGDTLLGDILCPAPQPHTRSE